MSDEKSAVICERCDQKTLHTIKSMSSDNRVHLVCWSCISREEKRVNLKSTWKRRGRSAGQVT